MYERLPPRPAIRSLRSPDTHDQARAVWMPASVLPLDHVQEISPLPAPKDQGERRIPLKPARIVWPLHRQSGMIPNTSE